MQETSLWTVPTFAVEPSDLVPAAPEVEDRLVDVPPEVFGFAAYAQDGQPEPRVSRRLARQVPAVKRSRDLICGALGGLPLVTVGSDLRVDRTSWLTQPERDVAPTVTMTRLVEDLLYEGVGWWYITRQAWNDYPVQVVRLEPRSVNVLPNGRVHNSTPGHGGMAWEWPEDSRLIRFDSPNDPLLEAGARAIRQYLRLASAAGRHADGVPPVDYFTPSDGVDPGTAEEIRAMLDDWQRARQRGATGYVPAALDYHSNGWDPDKLQLAEQIQHAVLEIARVAGVDPEELGVSTTSRTYANQFDRRKSFLDFTLGAYRLAIQGRLSMNDVTPRGTQVRFDLDEFLRTDALSRYQAAQAGLDVGALTKEEIREAEGKPPLDHVNDSGDTAPTTQENNVRTLPTPVSASAAADVIALSFADGPEHRFDAPASATFEVDQEARVIRGLAVPYGVEGVSNGQRFVFSQGSLKFADVKRVKLWVQHDPNRAIGVATRLEEREDGLHAEFSVARGEEGDRYLALAQDGVLDGLSIGLGRGGRFSARSGVQHAVEVPLMEVSLTPAPSFDGARTYSATSSTSPAGGGGDLGVEIRKAMMAGFADLGPTREFVGAGRATEINESAPYRFDGTQAEHEFSTDVFAAAKGDREAQERVTGYMADALDPATFAIAAADVADLNPARQRPDMYVDRLVNATPLWQALRKGSVTDGTPFIFPKFISAGNLVSKHVTMVEPNSGTFKAGKQTVTPEPLSGKVEVPREVMDAGGNPQVSRLIWREMERAYYDSLETEVATLLAAQNPTAIDLPAGATDQDLANALEAAYAALQFAPGGFRFDYAPTHQGLYQRLTEAVDGTGRKLYPILNPTNANGTTSNRFGAINVGGVSHLPVGSLVGNNGDGIRKSYLIASEDVHAWASPPRELRFEYQVAHIDIGIWGYVAAAVSRLDGVRVINYNRAGV